jgi:uncharacterized protein YqcC (DUF446 family)
MSRRTRGAKQQPKESIRARLDRQHSILGNVQAAMNTLTDQACNAADIQHADVEKLRTAIFNQLGHARRFVAPEILEIARRVSAACWNATQKNLTEKTVSTTAAWWKLTSPIADESESFRKPVPISDMSAEHRSLYFHIGELKQFIEEAYPVRHAIRKLFEIATNSDLDNYGGSLAACRKAAEVFYGYRSLSSGGL